MTATLTLAHLSDLHLTTIEGFHARYWNVKRTLGYLNWRRGRRAVHQRCVADRMAADAWAQGADHMALTGDLVNIGLPAEFEAAGQWLSALGPPDRVSIVPGNHDIYTSRMHGASCVERWRPYLASCDWGEQVAGAASHGFPYVRRLGDVALVGVNSAVPRRPFVAAGRVGHEQLARLSEALRQLGAAGLARVVLIHHPPIPGQAPRSRGLDDAEGIERVIRDQGAELVLHGHNHRDMQSWVQTPSRPVPVVGVASGSAALVHRREPLARYKLFRIRLAGGVAGIEMVTRGLVRPDGPIVEIDRRTLHPGSG